MRTSILTAVLAVMFGTGVAATPAFAAAGSGGSGDARGDDYVVLCHYDRNQKGPNAGPHTITINRHAAEQHLANHVKKDGFAGDDALGACGVEDIDPPVLED